jgi:hypothetical protein
MTDQARAHAPADRYVDTRRLRGVVSQAEVNEADEAVVALLSRSGADVSDVRVRISGANCRNGPGLVQINLTVGGTPARVQVSGRSISDAIEAATRRMEWKLGLLVPVVSSELAGWLDQQRRPFAIASPGQITRLKSVPVATITPAAASAALVAMDYNAHLFTDKEHGEDAIVYRGGPSGLRLSRQRSMRQPTDQTMPAIIVHQQGPPTMTPDEAVDWLVGHHLPHVFFTERTSGRGALLYRRYDGNLTLVTPHPVQLRRATRQFGN